MGVGAMFDLSIWVFAHINSTNGQSACRLFGAALAN